VRKFIRTIVSVTIALSITPLAARADQDLGGLKNQRGELVGEKKDAQNNLSQAKNNLSAAKNELSSLDRQLNEATKEINVLNDRLAETGQLINTTNTELDAARSKREKQYSTYKKRVRFMYENGSTGYLDVVLRASDVSDFLNRVEYVNRIVQYDKNLVKDLAATEALINDKLEEVKRAEREQQFMKRQQEERRAELASMVNSKTRMIQQLAAEESKAQQELNDLEAESRRIEALIRAEEARQAASKNPPAPVYKGGKLGWPLPSSGRISSGFIHRKNPVTGKAEFHKGIDIPAPYGSDIVAAEGGTVISATTGYGGGYGNHLVISHGNGLSTLYGHCSSLVAKQGQTVKKGQVIAKVGSTGNSTGNHLHFEVRVNGTPTDPMPYVK
jgi:murein DD-endopeptidase MepM/ murein hydrolase activator NlpD